MRIARQVLDARLFVTVTFAILALGRLAALVMPSDVYFTFQSLFADRPGPNIMLALLVKMLPPLLCGAGAGFVLFSAMRLPGASHFTVGLGRKLRCVWGPTVLAAGFFASFLSAWPNIAYWDLVSDPSVASLKAVFFVMYLLYMVSFGYVALMGLLAMVYWRERLSKTGAEQNLVSARELARVGALWLLNSSIASAVLKYVTP
jgi:hypothetical protein